MSPMQQYVEHRRLQQRRHQHLFSRRGRPGQHKNSRADNGADAQGCQADPTEGFFESSFWVFRVRDELIDVLTSEKLWVHPCSPLASGRPAAGNWPHTLFLAGYVM